MANINQKFGGSNQSITVTLASLANASARASTVIDNSTNVYMDALVQVSVKTNSTGTSSVGYVTVYAYATADGGTTYTDGATGTDGAITLPTSPNAKVIGVINALANSTTYRGGPFSVAGAFGGILPEKWGIIIENRSGAALDSTEGNHLKIYQGVYGQAV